MAGQGWRYATRAAARAGGHAAIAAAHAPVSVDYPPIGLNTVLTGTACFAQALMQALASLPLVLDLTSDGSHSAVDQFVLAMQYVAFGSTTTTTVVDIMPYFMNLISVDDPAYFHQQGDPSELFMQVLSAVPQLEPLFQWELCEYYLCSDPACPSSGAAQFHQHTPATWLVLQPRRTLQEAWKAAIASKSDRKCTKCPAMLELVTNPHDDPKVMAVVIERWNSHGHKDTTAIHWPLHYDLQRANGPTRFKLVAAIAHYGTTTRSGHCCASKR